MDRTRSPIRILRLAHGLTRRDMAAAASVSVRTVERLEAPGRDGFRLAHSSTRERVAAALHVPVDRLFNPDGSPRRPAPPSQEAAHGHRP
jgi:transcriptional regulator with XRE-family HTH domain